MIVVGDDHRWPSLHQQSPRGAVAHQRLALASGMVCDAPVVIISERSKSMNRLSSRMSASPTFVAAVRTAAFSASSSTARGPGSSGKNRLSSSACCSPEFAYVVMQTLFYGKANQQCGSFWLAPNHTTAAPNHASPSSVCHCWYCSTLGACAAMKTPGVSNWWSGAAPRPWTTSLPCISRPERRWSAPVFCQYQWRSCEHAAGLQPYH
jgi:hypothetical protein